MRKTASQVVIFAFWLGVWQLAAVLVHNRILLAGPYDTILALVQGAQTPVFWSSIGISFLQIVLGFLLAFSLALLFGAIAWKAPLLRGFLQPLVSFIKSVPVVCIIVLLLVWVGSDRVSIVAVSLTVFSPVYFSFLEGLLNIDQKMVDMLNLYRIPALRRVRYYYWPAVKPYVVSAAQVVVGIAWKSGIAAEVIGVPDGTVGAGIYAAKIGLDTAMLFAWTLLIVLISALCEKLFLRLLDALSHSSATLPQRFSSPAEDLPAAAFCLRDLDFSYEGASRKGALASFLEDGALQGKASGSGANASVDARGAGLRELAGDALVQGKQPEGQLVKLRSEEGRMPKAQQAKGRMLVPKQIFSGLSVSFDPGSRVCLMAPSGSGKTTLLDIMSGLQQPRNTESLVALPKRVCRLFQEDRLLEQLSAWDNVRLVAAWQEKSQLDMLKFDLDEFLNCDSSALAISACSGGMKRKIALMRALAACGDALLLDEPFAGMDDISRVDAVALINAHLRGRTLLVSTHDAADVDYLQAALYRLK